MLHKSKRNEKTKNEKSTVCTKSTERGWSTTLYVGRVLASTVPGSCIAPTVLVSGMPLLDSLLEIVESFYQSNFFKVFVCETI